MLNKRIEKNLGTYTLAIGNTTFKFKKETIQKAERTLNHFKKYKKVYQCIIAYFVVCASPAIFEFASFAIYDFVMCLASIEPITVTPSLCFKLMETTTNAAKVILLSLGGLYFLKASMPKIRLIED